MAKNVFLFFYCLTGASAVHLVGGVTGLIATVMLGPRTGRFDKEGESPKMSSPTNAIFGLFMLWWGWLGFNCGSTYGITEKKWVLATSYVTKKYKFDIVYIIDGILGALVSITAYCALARPWEGLVIGAIGGLITCLSVPLIEKLKIDDPVGVIPVHFIAAIWGMLSVGLFGEVDQLESFLHLNGLFRGGGFKLLGIQLLAVLVITFWTAVASYVVLKVLDLTIGLRVPLHEEILGADIVEHSINGSYDKTSGEWNDSEGRLIMIVDKSNPANYERTIRELKYHMREEGADNVWVRRTSFMGFSRSNRPSRSHWEEPRLDVDQVSDRSSGFVSTNHSPKVATISVPNGIDEELPPRRRSVDSDGLEVLVIPSISVKPGQNSGEFWSEEIVKQLRRKSQRGRRGNSR
ncbi:Ammonium transporter 2 [Holothuria leucospilota]|uniref:Ammonium transporter 2 n=1 Tax=Holothuria leucospilota TaxID=206669 RepID=A0A9Q1BNK6_HOLLE|nr:Ammonium transporter 2 [Holothuria leucospilota]